VGPLTPARAFQTGHQAAFHALSRVMSWPDKGLGIQGSACASEGRARASRRSGAGSCLGLLAQPGKVGEHHRGVLLAKPAAGGEVGQGFVDPLAGGSDELGELDLGGREHPMIG